MPTQQTTVAQGQAQHEGSNPSSSIWVELWDDDRKAIPTYLSDFFEPKGWKIRRVKATAGCDSLYDPAAKFNISKDGAKIELRLDRHKKQHIVDTPTGKVGRPRYFFAHPPQEIYVCVRRKMNKKWFTVVRHKWIRFDQLTLFVQSLENDSRDLNYKFHEERYSNKVAWTKGGLQLNMICDAIHDFRVVAVTETGQLTEEISTPNAKVMFYVNMRSSRAIEFKKSEYQIVTDGEKWSECHGMTNLSILSKEDTDGNLIQLLGPIEKELIHEMVKRTQDVVSE